MAYVVDKLTPADCERILADADERKRRRLNLRGEFVEDSVGMNWTVDRERNFYLLPAPRRDIRSMEAHFYMFLHGRMYELRVKGLSGPEVIIEDEVSTVERGNLEREFTEAIGVQGFRGRPMAPVFVES